MGLHVHSLVEIPREAQRSYYIYLLEYGWYEPLGEVLTQNFSRMAEIASRNNAVVIRSSERGVHFHDEVFSWHGVNGEEGDDVLPAILITDRHPREFKESYDYRQSRNSQDFRLILIPLNKYCSTTSDVVNFIDKIFNDVIAKKDLSSFSVAKEMNKGLGHALVDGLLLEPNIGGVGYDFNSLLNYFKQRKS